MLAVDDGVYAASVIAQFARVPVLLGATATVASAHEATHHATRFVAVEHALERHGPLEVDPALTAIGTVRGCFALGPNRVLSVSATAHANEVPCTSLASVFECGRRDDGEVLPRLPAWPAVATGDVVASIDRPVAADMAERYAAWSGDENPIHLDARAAGAAGFRAPILHGLCTLALATISAPHDDRDGDTMRAVRARFLRPAYPSEPLTVTYRSTEHSHMSAVVVRNASGIVLRGVVERGRRDQR
jgi:acyl dehydratase